MVTGRSPSMEALTGSAGHGFALPDFLFHGTSTLYLSQMLSEGLLPCTLTGEAPMTCLADDPEIAIHHAECISEFEDAPMAVFMIPISAFNPASFRLEDNFVRLGPSSGRGVALQHASSPEGWRSLPWTWQGMLEACGAVGYTAPIPVTCSMLIEAACAEGLRKAIARRIGMPSVQPPREAREAPVNAPSIP